MNTLHLKISIFISLFLTFVGSLSAQDEVDYGARFYEIKYYSQNHYWTDSVDILNIYGDVFLRNKTEVIRRSNHISCLSGPDYYIESDTLLRIKEARGWVTYDASGKIIKVNPFYDTINSVDGLVGLVDNTGKIIIPPMYDRIESYVYDPDGLESSFIAGKLVGDKMMFGIITIDNDVILPFEYSGINPNYEDFTLVEKEVEIYKNGEKSTQTLCGFIDWNEYEKSVKVLTDCVFDVYSLSDPFGKLIPIRDANTGLLGYIDKHGTVVIPCKYSDVCPHTIISVYGTVLWCEQTKKGVFDLYDFTTGKKIFFDCEGWRDGYWSGLLWVKKKNVWYCIDRETGKTKYSIACDNFCRLNNCWYKKDNIWTCIDDDETGKVRFSLNNDDELLWDFKMKDNANYACIKHDEKVGIVDASTGKVVIPCQYPYEKDVKFLKLSNKAPGYAIYVDMQKHTIDFIRLTDGKIVKSIERISKVEAAIYDYPWCWKFTDLDENIILCTASGQEIIGSEYHIKKCYYNSEFKFVVAESVGIFDNSGKLLLNLGEDFTNAYTLSSMHLAAGLEMCFYDKKNRSERREYYYVDGSVFTKMASKTELYRYYYTQCQEKFRKQPSDVDKNIPEAKTTRSNAYAFIIANEDYPSAPVPYGLNDGRSFKAYCEKTLGIPANHVILFENATQGKINSCVEQMKRAASANNGDIDILFYYAGHAFPDAETKTACLLPIDGDVTIPATGYSLDKLYGELGQLNVNSVVCFIDACFSGVTREDNSLLAGRAVIVQPKNSEPRGNTVVFTAADSTETAHQYQAKKHGMFTYYLLKKLQESNGEVTLGELADYLNSNVKKMSFEVNNKLQTPKVLVSPAMELKWRTLKLND